ncbi:biotin-protein ligase [Cercophora newfieldiana]|uniref:Biotin-protein ligase n=1 Tax=Cercophora newfieldiana TaxID=92897 RepID=A0AA39Y1H9_9PEZI|nr:biotin-protein ligase [Cercophora newfieldiana]
MASRKLNVLVYTGTGSTIESVRHCMYSLRRLLSPNYAVVPITESALLKEPWAPTCALLVVPGGADLGYCRALNGSGNRSIIQFVRRGGAYLGFCAGGYYGSQRCEFEVGNPELEVVGSRELAFFPGTCRGGAFKGFAYHSERGAKAAKIAVNKGALSETLAIPDIFKCYYNGGGVFVDAGQKASGIEVLAEYEDELAVDPGSSKAAVVYCKVGEGRVVLTGPHPEFAATNLGKHRDIPGYDALISELAADDDARSGFLKGCLMKLGLEVSQEEYPVPSLSKIHLSSLNHTEVGELLHSFEDIITREDDEEYVKGENDLFHLEKPDSRWTMSALNQALANEYQENKKKTTGRGTPDPTAEYVQIPKSVVSHETAWPEPKETPCFNHAVFYSSLREFRELESEAEEWGDVFMYGEVITSTNTLLEKNPKLLSKLSTGFTLAATTQVAGRGRGSNVWVAPPGSLLMSTVINHPAHHAATRPIVFLQYLAAIAIVEAVKSYDVGDYAKIPVKLKWPNDIYAQDPTKPDEVAYVKIGGILSNCSYSAGNYQVVMGLGVNTNNGRPTTSLDALLPLLNKNLPHFQIERLVARILTRMEVLYAEFLRTGFSRELEYRYYKHWLHSDQVVTLEAEGGVKARVLGITRDWGMLKAEEVREDGINGTLQPTGKIWALQSDENSFDFWRGLVRRKL